MPSLRYPSTPEMISERPIGPVEFATNRVTSLRDEASEQARRLNELADRLLGAPPPAGVEKAESSNRDPGLLGDLNDAIGALEIATSRITNAIDRLTPIA